MYYCIFTSSTWSQRKNVILHFNVLPEQILGDGGGERHFCFFQFSKSDVLETLKCTVTFLPPLPLKGVVMSGTCWASHEYSWLSVWQSQKAGTERLSFSLVLDSMFGSERLQVKIQDLIHTAIQSNQLHPGTAAKLYGCVTFLDQAVFDKIARAGLNALKGRQYLDHTNYLTTELPRSFSTISSMPTFEPRRIVFLNCSSHNRIAGASDAAQDATVGSGGFAQ